MNLEREQILKEIQKDYEAYRKNGGHLSIFEFMKKWVEHYWGVIK